MIVFWIQSSSDSRVKNLERIARACGALPVGLNYRKAFNNCTTAKERIARIHALLRDAGMTGILANYRSYIFVSLEKFGLPQIYTTTNILESCDKISIINNYQFVDRSPNASGRT